MSGDTSKPIGHQYALAMLDGGEDRVRSLAKSAGTQLTMDAFLRVQDEEPVPAFLHSALCAMSLPTKRPKDDTQPILREDGKYALAINPRPVLQNVDGKPVLRSLGVPYGAYPRVALIYLLSQAVTKRSRDVYLGRNFTEWMRRLGYQTVSYGPRGTANRMREQVDRLLACEWQIRWDGTDAGDNAFAVRDVKISNEYAGSLEKNGAFAREIRMSEAFYSHLIEHAVPLNEIAIRELKGTPTALDLYTYLAYRLPRITSDKGQTISWDQLARHLGNSADSKRFRQTVRETMQLVSAVYPNANVDMSGRKVVLHPSPAPLERKLVGPHLRLVGAPAGEKAPRSSVPAERKSQRDLPQLTEELRAFPEGSLSFGTREGAFRKIGLEKGQPWSVDTMADAFRAGFPGIAKLRTDTEWLRVWEAFVVSYAKRRSQDGGD
ncbi:replication protein RepA [Novosphingobium pentaromativorans]|uniref:Plasmid encoded RepA protein n=1 Tax=Novosphingobium pentaromativorans US6-1 TaxID=1088721 RepID=G6EFX0_9SPHN|nr:replication protein RepA [Novosphingobium pentaromativorans]AIT82331.1 pirin [Novosphingobium pentaromativorans US6-1]EHJ59659.1 plasmid encoded RepA protein [Novosphingobium pentaromativorans US6-1]